MQTKISKKILASIVQAAKENEALRSKRGNKAEFLRSQKPPFAKAMEGFPLAPSSSKPVLRYSAKGKKQISQNRVTMIAESMNRSQLKQFIKALRNDMLSSTVYVDTATPISQTGQSEFENQYPNKDVVFSVDPEILLGCRVKNNDLVYEGDLQSRLKAILEGVKNDAAN